jgi:hypothetical protein
VSALAFEYRLLKLARGREVWPRVAKHVTGKGAGEVRARGGVVTGLFQPQIGFASNEAVLLTGWPNGVPASGGDAAVAGLADIVAAETDLLVPTLRPKEALSLASSRAKGIYVHRWFTIDAEALDEFVGLSGEAWETFERNFDAGIVGLFRAEPKPGDDPVVARLLLLTRYGSHGVWEASRNEAADPEAWRRFMRRQELTRETIARSTLLVVAG